MDTNKQCGMCGEVKPILDFHKSKTKRLGAWIYCKSCENKRARERRAKDKDTYRSIRLKNRHGITLNDYNEILRDQNNCCLICGSENTRYKGEMRVLVVDHCHDTGKIRGLLCNLCNLGLGYFKDRVDLLSRAITYLEVNT